MWIDANNVDSFVGKTVDSKRRLFHSYPLTIMHRPDFGYCFMDATRTIVLNNFEREPIYFDTVVSTGEAAQQEGAAK